MLLDTIVAHHISCQTLTLCNLIHFTDQLRNDLRSKHISLSPRGTYEPM